VVGSCEYGDEPSGSGATELVSNIVLIAMDGILHFQSCLSVRISTAVMCSYLWDKIKNYKGRVQRRDFYWQDAHIKSNSDSDTHVDTVCKHFKSIFAYKCKVMYV
jgi:hypothetical protein